MSSVKHNSYRKVLQINRFIATFGNEIKVPAITVIWCSVLSTTSRTIKTDLIGTTTYVGSHKIYEVDARHYKVPVSVNLKNPMQSKVFLNNPHYIEQDFKTSFSGAGRKYILKNEKLSKNLVGTVVWFNMSNGEGSIRCNLTDRSYRIYACNIQGKKTWYAETACMFVKGGETVIFDLADMGDHLTCCNVRGNIYLDEVKWNDLKDKNLAFRCDETGSTVTGLFE